MLYFSSFAKVKYTGPTIALSLAVALLAALTLAPAMLACWARRSSGRSARLILPPRADRGIEGPEAPAHGILGRVADLVVHHPLAILSVCLIVLAPAGGGRRPYQIQLQPARRPRPGSAQRGRARSGQAVFRRRRAEPGGRPDRPPRSGLPLAGRARRDRGDHPPAACRSRMSPRSAR